MCKPLDRLIYQHKTRRQQKGMPDRWRLLERLDPTRIVLFRSVEEDVKYSSCICVRQSEIDELREKYGDDMEVL